MPKFSPGDLVWARPPEKFSFNNFLTKEVPAVVEVSKQIRDRCCIACGGNTCYSLDICPRGIGVCECLLRPRRDDYQQHEGLGSMNLVSQPLADDKPPEPLPRHVVKAIRFALMYSTGPDTIRRMLKRG